MTHTESDSLREISRSAKIPFKDLLRIWRRRQELSQSVIGQRFGVSHAAVSDWEAGKSDLPNRVLEELYWDFHKILIEPIQEPAIDEVSKALGLTDKPYKKRKPTYKITAFNSQGEIIPHLTHEIDFPVKDKPEEKECVCGNGDICEFHYYASRSTKHKEENPPLSYEIDIDRELSGGALALDGLLQTDRQIEHLARQSNAIIRHLKANR